MQITAKATLPTVMPEISAGDNPPPVPEGGLLPLLVAGDGPGDGPFPGVVVTAGWVWVMVVVAGTLTGTDQRR